ncbi:MAG: hypothetical protein JEZ06_10905 [Anaerolineaceae bacterium]|nr:hypothetical protein [Anaerolineaceae bacterium]
MRKLLERILLISFLEGIIALVILFLKPSEVSFFLGYSKSRWLLGLGQLGSAFPFLLIFFLVKKDNKKVDNQIIKIEGWLKEGDHLFWASAISILLSIFFACAFYLTYRFIYDHLRWLFLWSMLVFAQIFIFLRLKYANQFGKGSLPEFRIIDLIIASFLVLLAIYTLVFHPIGHDINHHIFRLNDTQKLFSQGKLLFYLSPMAGNGKGLPVYVFYSAWIYIIPSLFMGIGFPLYNSLLLTVMGFALLSFFSFYKFANLHVNSNLAKLGALFYLTSNFFLAFIFVRFPYSEFLGCALIPLLLYSLSKWLLDSRGRYLLLSILVLAFIILFHSVSFMNCLPLIGLYILYLIRKNKNNFSYIWKSLPVFIIGLLLTAFFWFPALLENKYVLGIKGFPTHYQDTFLKLSTYLQPTNYENIGILLVLFFGVSLWITINFGLIKKIESVKGHLIIFGGIIFYNFMTLKYSTFIWKNISILQTNTYVWRNLFPLTILTSLYIVLSLSLLPDKNLTNKIIYIASLLLIFQSSIFISSYKRIGFTYPHLEEIIINQMISDYASQESGWGRIDYIPDPEYARKSPPDSCVIPINQENYEKGYDYFVIDRPVAQSDCLLHLPFYWNIRYKAYIGEDELPVYADENGEILIPVPEKDGPISVQFTVPIYVSISKTVSLVVFCLLIIFFFVSSKGILTW